MTSLMERLLALPVWLALIAIFALPALESSVFLGFVFPGELALLLGGVVAGQGHLPVAGVLAAGVGGAIAGDAVGYVVGRRWGRRILDSTVGRLVRAEHLDRAESVLGRRGGSAVLLGRFTVALRVLIPGLAGMSRMPYRRFAFFNVGGAVAWGVVVVAAGYLAGNSWHAVQHVLSGVGIAATLLVLSAFLGARALRRRRRRRTESVSSALHARRPTVAPCPPQRQLANPE